MKGQASLEAFLILAVVLAVLSGFFYVGRDTSQSVSAVSAVEAGAENAITKIEVETGISIDKRVTREADNIVVKLNYWGSGISEESMKENVRNSALKFLYQAFNGSFPDDIPEDSIVSTSSHDFLVLVNAQRVTR